MPNHLQHKKFNLPAPHLYASRRWNNKRVGLLGGSFNPPHDGHMHIATAALRRYKFHAIWWLVSPQNPIKSKSTRFSKRLRMTQKFIAKNPKMVATDIEAKMNIAYSYQTVKNLKKHYPKTRFTWIAGMDNAYIFHKWDQWTDLLKIIPFIFFNRPPNSVALSNNAVRMSKRHKNVRWNLKGKTRNISSTALRKKRIAHFFKYRV